MPQNDLMSSLTTGHYTSPQNRFLYSCVQLDKKVKDNKCLGRSFKPFCMKFTMHHLSLSNALRCSISNQVQTTSMQKIKLTYSVEDQYPEQFLQGSVSFF